MSDRFEVVLGRPAWVPSINAVSGSTWRRTLAVKEEWQQVGWAAGANLKAQLRRKALPTTPTERAQFQLGIDMAGHHRRDPHNYMGTVVKWFIDGLVYSTLLVDDDDKHLSVLEPQFTVVKRSDTPMLRARLWVVT